MPSIDRSSNDHPRKSKHSGEPPVSGANEVSAGDLRSAVSWMDGLSQEGTAEIEALVAGAQACLSHGNDAGAVWRLLESIKQRAEGLRDHVNSEAERVGANYREDAFDAAPSMAYRRWKVAE